MGKATRERALAFDGMLPTDEQMQGGTFRPLQIVEKGQVVKGVAFCRRPMIDILADQGVLSDSEHKALRHYRHHADIADRSPMRDSLDRSRGGNGTGPGIELLNAIRVRDDIERAVGSLCDILRAVVIYDMSLSQWAINQAGGIDELDARGKHAVWRIKPRRKALAIARLEIQMAAKRVEAEIAA